MSESLKYERSNIELRRGRVLELAARGMSQNDISRSLNVAASTISLDLQYLRCRAEDNLRRHIQDSLPLTYDKAMSAFTQVISKTWNMAENAHDERTKLQAYSQFMDCWKYVMDMTASSPRITSALKYVSDLESKRLEQESQQEEQEPTEQGQQPSPVSEQDPMLEDSEDVP
jgi:IS30 family transposase